MAKNSESLDLLINLTKFQTVLSRRLDSVLGGLGLNEFIVLSELGQADGKLRRIDLAERIGLTASGVTRLLLPMEKVGLIERGTNEKDARSSYVVLRPAGKEKYQQGLERAEIFCEEIFSENDSLGVKAVEKYILNLSKEVRSYLR